MASLGGTVGKMMLSSLTSFQSAGTRHTCELGTSHQSVVKPFMDWPEIQMIQRNFFKVSENKDTVSLSRSIYWNNTRRQRTSSVCLWAELC